MNKLLKKIQIIQFIIIISFFILSENKNDENYLNKNTEYYNFLKNIVKYNEITKKFVKKNNDKFINFSKEYKLLLDNNDYFYIFYNNNVYTYFFKEKNSDKHTIYFNGINNINDIKIVLNTIYDIISSNFNFDNIEKLLNKKGLLYKIEKDKLEINHDKYSVLDVFDYLYNKIYLQDDEKIELTINGFSLGGPISQLFTLFLLDKYNNLNIDMYNIESWFGGNEEIYDKMMTKINIFNIYNQKSVFYFFNLFFQKYFKSNYLINDNEEKIIDYNVDIFPMGIINYVIDNHLLSKILKK